ncbi:D-alanyl-D-alanine carboxypeptidase [Rhizobium paknamense]|uniref:D-alanyl-D-alanine carboxypeptidase n=1 Tax=Rhizobium paknamense TaxID=1206817 RepID=UPI0027D86612|nr:D-alanyl-D-alanine carboxypeptidase [Rhizobium paknamense]
MNRSIASLLGRSVTIRRVSRFSLALLVVGSALVAQTPAEAAGPRYADIVIDANNGKVLHATDPDGLRYPASLTKMMTLYLTFEALEKGRIRLDSRVPVSAHAASEPPSKLGLKPGSSITVEQAILGLVTRSANDAATALGEYIGGSEPRFAQMMTSKARALGMSRTTYRNANGLPNPSQMTTARDQARLGIALRQHFPQYYPYFSTRSFAFGKQVIGNHNRLLGNVKGVDGIKTGFTNASGFNLVTSLQLEGRSLVGVVLGGASGASRDSRMRQLVLAALPEASSRGSGAAIARANRVPEPVEPVQTRVAEAPRLPKADVPVPGARYQEMAEVASDESDAPDAQAYAKPSDTSAAVAALAAQAPMPQKRKHGAAAKTTPPASVDHTVTNSTAASSGWTVQIGTSDSRDGAMDLLKSAQGKAGKSLRGAKPLAVAFGEGSSQVYRARFGGFQDQKDAVNACNALKKSGVKCWAAMQ